LAKLRLSLLAINHLFSTSIEEFALSFSSDKVVHDMNRLVSSANSLTFSLDTALPMSLAYSRNNRGPKADPCGTPELL